MYAPLVAPIIIGLGGGLFLVWLIASIVPVDGRNLPALLRVARFPVSRDNPPTSRQIAAMQVRSSEGLWAYRLFLSAIVLLSQTAQLRSATDAHLAASMGNAPVVEAFAEWILMLAWSGYVVVEFRRAATRTRP
jgi:hypothetical protein